MGTELPVSAGMKDLAPLLLLCLAHKALSYSCSNFTEAACELTENNILAHDRFTDTPGACQELCRQEEGCTWFTHFENNCYMLDHCGELATCEICVSGPIIPTTTPTTSRKPIIPSTKTTTPPKPTPTTTD